jgi:cell division protein FtsI/penicillin-binding protein 2
MMSERRIKIIQVLIALWMLAIGAKLVYLQVYKHEWLSERAERQHFFKVELTADRGVILDREDNTLARSVKVKSLYAAPASVKNPNEIAARLSAILDIDRDVLLQRLRQTDKMMVALKRKLSDEEAARVEELQLTGLHFIKEMKRDYVNGATAAHVLGFVDFDEKGQSGIERSYEKTLSGQPGHLLLSVDVRKNPFDHDIEQFTPGANVKLTIDQRIQHAVESALARAVRQTNARAGTIVMMRPSTGEILALANYPTFDPNRVSESNDEQRRNRAVENAFEPGSIFKIVTYAAALEEGEIRPDSRIDCGGGVIRLPGRVIHDHPYGSLSVTQALAKSSNAAAIRVAQRLGNERLASYIEAFGFGRQTGVELPSETRGLLRPVSQWTPISIGAIPLGYEISVNAIQSVAAFATIANGGQRPQPFLVSKITAASGEVIEDRRPEMRRVVSQQTADSLKYMLEGVVIRGTGKRAQTGGYRAAGKTGTAEKLDPLTKRYSRTLHIASFAGFAPVENPEIACIVSLDEPKGARMGGDAAAPVFAQVVTEALQILGVPLEGNPDSDLMAKDIRRYDLLPEIVEETSSSLYADESDDEPPASTAANAQGAIASNTDADITMPDLSGRSLREAVAMTNSQGLKIKAIGDGIVSSQSPPPGTLVSPATMCIVKLSKKVNNVRQEAATESPPGPARRATAGMK